MLGSKMSSMVVRNSPAPLDELLASAAASAPARFGSPVVARFSQKPRMTRERYFSRGVNPQGPSNPTSSTSGHCELAKMKP